MKKLLIIFYIFLCLFGARPVFAAEKHADSTAQLQIAAYKSPKDTRIQQIESVLYRYGSPMQGTAKYFVQYADTYNLDWKLVAAIAGVESGFGKAIPQYSYNAWGWGIPTGAQSGIAFSNWKHGIETVSSGLKHNYIDRGALTIEQIGKIYAASPTWSQKVRHFIAVIENTPIISPTAIEVTI